MGASGLWQDIRFAARVLAKDRVFTAAVVASLALGIGAATTVFTIVYATNLRALPFANPREIVTVVGEDAHGDRRDPPLGLLEAWRNGPTGFSGLAAWRTASVNLADDDRAPDRYAGTFLTSNAFALLGERPALGRDFRPEDDRPGAPPVILLGHRPWVDRYGADPAVVGRTVRVNGVPTIVIGVMRDGFRFPYRSDVWQPLAAVAADGADVAVFGRLTRGTSAAQAAASLTSFATGWSPPGQSSTGPVRPVVMSLNERFVGEATDLVPVLSAVAAGFVLLIACANAASLLLARARRARARSRCARPWARAGVASSGSCSSRA